MTQEMLRNIFIFCQCEHAFVRQQGGSYSGVNYRMSGSVITTVGEKHNCSTLVVAHCQGFGNHFSD